MTRRSLPFALALAALLAATPSEAQTNSFFHGCDHPNQSSWNCPGNWTLGRVPQDGDDVVVVLNPSDVSTISGTFTASHLNSLTLSVYALDISGTVSVGQLQWSRGSIGGGAHLTITGTGSVWSTSARAKAVSDATLTIAPGAEVTWTGGGLQANYGGVLVNAGLLDIQTDAHIDHVAGAQPTFINEATGTLRKSGSDNGGPQYFEPFLINNGGTIEVLAGTLGVAVGGALHGGTYHADAGAELIFGCGTFTTTGTLSGSPSGFVGQSACVTGTYLVVEDGTTATFDFSGAGYQWRGGNIEAPGSGVLTNTGLIHATTGGKAFRGDNRPEGDLVLRNEGTFTWSGGTLGVNDAALIENAGLFDLQTDAHFDHVANARPTFVNEATGTLRKSVGTGGLQYFEPFLTNDGGTIEVQAGALGFSGNGVLNGGIYTAAAGARLLFASGTYTASGIVSGAPDGLVGHDAGATLTTTGTATLDFAGAGYQWEGGNVEAPGDAQLTNAGLLVATTAAAKAFSGDNAATGDVVLRNEGTLRWEEGNVQGNAGATVVNAGLFDIQTDATFDWVVSRRPTIVNADGGTLVKSAGAGTVAIEAETINQAGGTILANSGVLNFTSPLDNQPGATLGGTAILNPNPNTPYGNDGLLAPGDPTAGILVVQAHLTQSESAELDLDIGGPEAGTEYDRLVVDGALVLDGVLRVRIGNGYVPAIGTEFVVAEANAVSGDFATVDLPSGLAYEVTETTVVVRVVGLISSEEGPADPAAPIPDVLALSAAHPNPSRGDASFRLDVPVSGPVTVEAFDALGRRVAVLHEGEAAAGSHALRFEGGALPSGVYVVRLRAGDELRIQRVTLLR